MTNSVANRQIFFLLLLTITSYTAINLPKIVAESAGRSGWILLLVFALVFGLAASMIAALNNRFKGKVLFDYSQEIAGKIVSRLLAVYYILYFAVIGVSMLIRLMNYLSESVLRESPNAILLAVSVTLFCFCANKGVTNVARLFEVLGITFLFVTILLLCLMLPQGILYNVQPLVDPYDFKQFGGSLLKFVFPYGGIEVLLIIPFTKANKRSGLVAFCTLIFIGLLYVFVVDSTLSILGINNTIVFNDPFIEAIKVVELPILERPDVFYLTTGLSGLFSGAIIVLLAMLEYACRLFPKVPRYVMTLICGGVLYVAGLIGLSIKNTYDVLENIVPYMIMLASFVIPAGLYILAKVRRKPGDAA